VVLFYSMIDVAGGCSTSNLAAYLHNNTDVILAQSRRSFLKTLSETLLGEHSVAVAESNSLRKMTKQAVTTQ